MKTIKIKGKDYIMVNERIKEFRQKYPDWTLDSNIIFQDKDTITIKATILDNKGRLIASGTAHEDRNNKSSMVNSTSHIENCETSAWGRALGNLGIGIDDSIASAEEVVNAKLRQIEPKQEVYGVDDVQRAIDSMPPMPEILAECPVCKEKGVLKTGVSEKGFQWRGVQCKNCGKLQFLKY